MAFDIKKYNKPEKRKHWSSMFDVVIPNTRTVAH
jgi:hypothetical protein